jgi:hypothetical protein
MKIERRSHCVTPTIRLIGHFQSEHVEELKKQLQDNGPRLVLDLKDVTIVDVEVVRLLGACELEGMKILDCPNYIREWILREQKRTHRSSRDGESK